MSKRYSKQQLPEAVSSSYASKTAATKFHVPLNTIRRHRHSHSLKPRVGRPDYLTNDEEAYFISMLQLLPDYGFHASKDIVLQLANDYCQSLELDQHLGDQWLRLFMQKHINDIKWKREQKMKHSRAASFTEEARVGWFLLLKDFMTKHNLLDKPQRILNVDETGFSDQAKGG